MVLDTGRNAIGNMDCDEWAELLADHLDGVLPPGQQGDWEAHAAGCASCGLMLDEVEQGRDALRLLRDQTPQPPVELLGRILEQTGAAGRGMDHPVGAFATAQAGGNVLAMRQRWGHRGNPFGARDARLLLTAAMAFFSVALTLSMVGVRFSSVDAAELKPGTVEANVTRSFYGTKKQVVSFYENLRFVYEVEARMRAMRGGSEAGSSPAPERKPASPAAKPHGHASAEPAGREEWMGAPVLARMDAARPAASSTPEEAGEERGGL